MASIRQERVARLLKEEISQILRDEIHDPLIKAVKLVSVTDVEISPDLKTARIFVSLFGEPETTRPALEHLVKAELFIRAKISERIRDLKFVPEIRIIEDTTPAEADRLMRIFYKMEKKEEDSPG
jgi:ribosome-binding factor A